MKKNKWVLIFIVVATGATAYFTNSYIERKNKWEADLVEKKRKEKHKKDLSSAVLRMASQTNAITNWEAALSNGKKGIRFAPILTYELEQLWLQQRPILFIGRLKDIATYDASHYSVSVEKNYLDNFFHNIDYMFQTKFQLSMLSNKNRIKSFIKETPNLFTGFQFENVVAVVARINSIRTSYAPVEEGGQEEIKIGDGELVDIMYIGEMNSL